MPSRIVAGSVSRSTKTNSASGSTKRRMSHGQATRSTLALRRVTQRMIHLSGDGESGGSASAGGWREGGVQRVEQCRAALDAPLVVGFGAGDAGQQELDPGCL